ncbi:hypothetical protein AMECASPLE_034377 [Ameca splendens]|uniref:Uncharacterized protein n=1 Tax=Ameca splendens TaxID=208324 RepID=A0ABV0YJ31_9TELE
MQNLGKSLAGCPSLSVLDLSGGKWDEETLKTLTQFVPRFSVTERIILNGSCSSVQCVVAITALLSDCPSVTDINIRLQDPAQVSVVFSGGREKTANVLSKTLWFVWRYFYSYSFSFRATGLYYYSKVK